jgi:hypothetical protein
MKKLVLIFGLLLLIGISAGYTDNFQNFDSSLWATGGTVQSNAITTYTYSDTYGLGIVSQVAGAYQCWAYYNTQLTTNYGAATLVQNNTVGQNYAARLGFLDSGGNQIATFELYNSPTGRYYVERESSVANLYYNGVYVSNVSCAAQPAYFFIGTRNNYNHAAAPIIWDDYVVASGITDVVGLPPHTWFVGKDLIDPSVKGLFDASYNNVYTDVFHYTISNSTGTSINSYNITNPPTSGTITITSGTASDYINCKAVALSGTNLAWNESTYSAGDTALLTWVTSTQYWNSTLYDYHVKITRYNTDNTTTVVKTTTVTTANGTTTFTSATEGYFLAELQLAPKTAPNTWYTLASNWSTWLNGIKLRGYTYDGYAGTILGNTTLVITQGSTSNSTSSDSSGYYTCAQTWSVGQEIVVNATKTNYTATNFSYTFSNPGTMQIDMTLLPYNGTSAPIVDGFPIWNGTAIYGLVTADPYNFAVPGATVTCTGQNSTVTNTGGYYHFDNLTNSTAYTVQASATGYGTSSLATVTTGIENSGTRQDLLLQMGFNITVGVIDYYSGAYISGANVQVNGGTDQTTNAGGKTSYNLPYGYYTFSATKADYDAGNTSGTISMNQTVYISLTPNGSTSQNQNLLYTPHLTRMYFTDEWGNRLSGLTVTATPTGQSTAPTSWLNSILGLPTGANMQNTTLSGTTAADGSISFLMVEILNYNVVASGVSPINGATINQQIAFYPKDTDYSIKINTGLHTNLQAYPVYSLNATPNANSTQFNLSMNYTGTNTTTLTFYVIKNNVTVVYSTVLGGGGSASYLANNTRGDTYTYGFNATNSMGENNVVQAWQDITMKGSGALFDFGLSSEVRMWIALASIFVFAAFWGTTTIKQGAFLTPFVGAGFWWYVGWLPAEMGTIIFACSFIGALLYMRGQENKTMEA